MITLSNSTPFINMKSTIISAAVLLAPAAAIAGPYVNVEANQSYQEGVYGSTTTEAHVGYEADLGKASSWYIQGGPGVVSKEGEGMENIASGKVGLNVAVTEKLDAYGEIAAATADDYDFDDLSVGVKAGVKYSF